MSIDWNDTTVTTIYGTDAMAEARRVMLLAKAAVIASLTEAEFDRRSYKVDRSCDESGLRIDIQADAGDHAAIRRWRGRFGRSYGPVRIFLTEAK